MLKDALGRRRRYEGDPPKQTLKREHHECSPPRSEDTTNILRVLDEGHLWTAEDRKLCAWFDQMMGFAEWSHASQAIAGLTQTVLTRQVGTSESLICWLDDLIMIGTQWRCSGALPPRSDTRSRCGSLRIRTARYNMSDQNEPRGFSPRGASDGTSTHPASQRHARCVTSVAFVSSPPHEVVDVDVLARIEM